jgi:putative ABC transport system permease protein
MNRLALVLSLALRNLLRNRRRSLTSLLAVMIGGFSLLLFGGYVRNITYGLETGFVTQSGHFQIQRKDYFLYGNGNPAAYGIDDYDKLIAAVKASPALAPMLAVVTPTLQLGGIAGNFAAAASRTVVGMGIVVDDQNRMRLWNEYAFPVLPAPLALTGTSSDAAVIGTGVARALDLCAPLKVSNCRRAAEAAPAPPTTGAGLADDIAALSIQETPKAAAVSKTRIELLAPNTHGAPNMAQLNIVKAEEQGVKELDDIFVALHLAQAQKLIYGNGKPKVTAIEVQLTSTRAMPAAEALLQEVIAKSPQKDTLTILDFRTLNPFYEQTIRLFDVIFGFISLLIGTIVVFMLGNTMSMAVVERTVEIGTLRAIGLKRREIRNLFVLEGLMLGLFGAVLGIALAILAANVINWSGLSWTPPGRITEVPLTVRVWGEWKLIGITGIGLVLIAGLSAWWPSQQAARMNIVDALRHV